MHNIDIYIIQHLKQIKVTYLEIDRRWFPLQISFQRLYSSPPKVQDLSLYLKFFFFLINLFEIITTFVVNRNVFTDNFI